MGNRLYVGNLSFHSDTEAVRAAFTQYGEVTDVHIVTDRATGQSRGFAFVTMGSDEQAQRAIEGVNGQMIDGRPLRVNEAEERPQPVDHGHPRRQADAARLRHPVGRAGISPRPSHPRLGFLRVFPGRSP